MKYYVFCTTVLFMLFFSLTGLYLALHSVLRHLDPLLGPATAFAVSIFTLCALIVALAWSVPSRGDAMKRSFTFNTVTDEYLAGLKHPAQFLLIEYGDRDACEAVPALTAGRIRRCVRSVPIAVCHAQATHLERNRRRLRHMLDEASAARANLQRAAYPIERNRLAPSVQARA
ncbi:MULTISPECIES: hypothetical protein [Burkholderiaceae]|uniref:hypothetical protein n=2 Tax=Burkholderiales TaxID=80840 RepID=UPI00095D94B6|nr:hypothetical protein [Burkholderia sp. b13]SIT71266.1 hypothetical protein SAMN04487768_2182 [Burkholderia sp. b13]